MFLDMMTRQVQVRDGKATLNLPFPNEEIAWPLIAPRRDYGKFVMGLFEGESSANGAKVHAVSTWTTPKDVVAAISQNSNREVTFNPLPADVFSSILEKAQGPVMAAELTETMRLIGEYNYYGKGEEKNQSKHDKWLLKDAETISYPQVSRFANDPTLKPLHREQPHLKTKADILLSSGSKRQVFSIRPVFRGRARISGLGLRHNIDYMLTYWAERSF